MKTVSVSIGRNLGAVNGLEHEPMPAIDWTGFQRAVDFVVRAWTETVHFCGTGQGEYQGVKEESATWIFDVGATGLDAIRSALSVLARSYWQDSIALSTLDTEFIPARKDLS